MIPPITDLSNPHHQLLSPPASPAAAFFMLLKKDKIIPFIASLVNSLTKLLAIFFHTFSSSSCRFLPSTITLAKASPMPPAIPVYLRHGIISPFFKRLLKVVFLPPMPPIFQKNPVALSILACAAFSSNCLCVFAAAASLYNLSFLILSSSVCNLV